MTRFWHHPESECVFLTQNNEQPGTDGCVEEVDEAVYDELFVAYKCTEHTVLRGEPAPPSKPAAPPGECYGDWQCHVAPSPIEKAERCIFLWRAGKIDKRVKKTKLAKAGEIGDHCHKEMDSARKGEIPHVEMSQLAQIAFNNVPSGVWAAEKHIDHLDIGLPWRLFGKRDLLDLRPSAHRIWDYKFSSEPEKWMPGNLAAGDNIEPLPGPRPADWDAPKILSHDTQMVLYAWAHLCQTGVIPEVGHVQTNVNTGISRRVWTTIPAVELVRQWLRIRDIVLRMHKASQQPIHEVETCGYPGRGSACWDYNRRCDAYDFCLETERDRARTRTTAWEV